MLNHHGIPDLVLGPPAAHDYEPSDHAKAEFLSTVTYGDFMAVNNMLDWKYEQRRMAQKILPFLFLGPMTAAKDKQFLRREGITMLLAVRNTMSAQAKLLNVSKIAEDLGLHTVNIDVASSQELIAAFPRAIKEINSHMHDMYISRTASIGRTNSDTSVKSRINATTGKVLVFCESGNERSAAVVAAYLIAMYNMDFIKTIQILQAQRFCVAFDDSLKALLQTFAAMVQAKRDVARSNLTHTERLAVNDQLRGRVPDGAGSAFAKGAKRNLDEAYTSEVDMDNTSGNFDDERFEDRDGYPPFQDTPLL